VPVLVAERSGREGAPTVLFYGHYDVQPEDPLAGWRTPPFEPALIEGRVYARGAQDNKGQVFGFLQGVKALVEAGESLPTIKLVLEGQEESGSSALNDLAPILRQRLQADVMMVSDTSCGPANRPAIVAGAGVQHLTSRWQVVLRSAFRRFTRRGAPSGSGHGGELATLHNGRRRDRGRRFRKRCRHPAAGRDGRYRGRRGDGLAVRLRDRLPACRGRLGWTRVARQFRSHVEIERRAAGTAGRLQNVIPRRAVAKLSIRLVPEPSAGG
jgi:acetylornithine deacetylase/succinyl-diaminopimelate desuccinylase-like protein